MAGRPGFVIGDKGGVQGHYTSAMPWPMSHHVYEKISAWLEGALAELEFLERPAFYIDKDAKSQGSDCHASHLQTLL